MSTDFSSGNSADLNSKPATIGRAPDDPGVLEPRLDAFARWHGVRAALQVFTFFVLLWALASI